MPIRQRDADQNIQEIKTLNDITVQTPLPVSIPDTLTATDTILQARVGGTNSTPALTPGADTGLSGVIRGLWKDVSDRFLSLVGTTDEAASSTGSLLARLRKIAENSGGTSGGSTGGTTDVGGVETRLGATNEAAATSDTATSGLNGILRRYLARFTAFLDVLGTTTDTASATGTLMARLRQIATNGVSSGTMAANSSAVDIASVSVTTTATTIAEIITADFSYLTLWIQNTGTVTLNELKTEAGVSATLPFKYAFLAGAASSGSYSTGTGKQSGNSLIPIIFANNLPLLTGGSEGFVEVDVRRYQRIRLQASVATGTTTVVINGILKR